MLFALILMILLPRAERNMGVLVFFVSLAAVLVLVVVVVVLLVAELAGSKLIVFFFAVRFCLTSAIRASKALSAAFTEADQRRAKRIEIKILSLEDGVPAVKYAFSNRAISSLISCTGFGLHKISKP